MYVGLSLSFCVRDIQKGLVPLDQVVKIVANTAASSPDVWNSVLDSYKSFYWSDAPEESEAIARKLIAEGKVEQPRLQGDRAHHIANGHWIRDGQVVRLPEIIKGPK